MLIKKPGLTFVIDFIINFIVPNRNSKIRLCSKETEWIPCDCYC